jgi:hypothetical protein
VGDLQARRADGARAGGFPAPSGIRPAAERRGRKRVGLLPQERTPVREGAEIVDEAEIIGSVCSGGFGPTRRPVGDGLPRQRLCRTGHASLGHRSWEKGAFACKQNAICSTTLLSWLIDCSISNAVALTCTNVTQPPQKVHLNI